MSVLHNPVPLPSYDPRHHSESSLLKAMTTSHPERASHLTYGLITPPSEMRSSIDLPGDEGRNNVLGPPGSSRYYLRRQAQPPPQQQLSLYPLVNNNYQNNSYSSLVSLSRRRSGSSSATTATTGTTASTAASTTTTTTTTTTNGTPNAITSITASQYALTPVDLDSRDLNIEQFTATMVCFLWFEPIGVFEHAAAYGERPSSATQLRHLSEDSVPANDFIEFCTRVIKTTLVSREVVVLGLLFIHRLRLRNPGVDGKSGSQWRIFTIALMLGNKILDDNTYTNKTWADVTQILDVNDIKIMEVEFLSQMRYNLYVTPEQWNEWRITVTRMYSYQRDVLRQRALPKKVYPSIPPSPPVSSAATSPSFPEPYGPLSTSPYRMHFTPGAPERMSSPHRLPLMEDSPSSASAALHARVSSRKRSREDTSLPPGLQPPSAKRYQQYPSTPLTQIPTMQQQRVHYAMEQQVQTHAQVYTPQPRASLTLTLPDTSTSPSPFSHTYQPISPSYPTSPFATSPLSPYSTNSNYNSLSPYASMPHRTTTPQQHHQQQALMLDPPGYASGFSSPYKYLQNRFSPYAPVRPARTLPSQFVPPTMQFIMPISSEELRYQPLGMHGHSGLRRGIPPYNPGYQYPDQNQPHN